MKRFLVVLLVAAASLVGATAYAHHSFAATYLEDKNVTIEGDIVQFLFRNPHSWVHVNVKEKSGEVVRYAVEWGGTGQLGAQGVTRDSLKIGDHVIISGNPARKAENHQVRMLSLHRTTDGFGWGKKPGETVD
jgi:hypothetical protein